MNKSKNNIDIKIAASRRPVSFATSAAKSFSESPPWQALVSSSLLKLQYLSPSCADVCSMVSYGVIRLFSTYYSFYFFLSILPSSSSTQRPFEHSETCPPVGRYCQHCRQLRQLVLVAVLSKIDSGANDSSISLCSPTLHRLWQASSLSTLAKFLETVTLIISLRLFPTLQSKKQLSQRLENPPSISSKRRKTAMQIQK